MALLVMKGVVVLDQAPYAGALLVGERLLAGRAVDQGQQVIGGRSDPDRQVPGGADSGPAVGEDDHALDRDRLAALAQEPFQVVGRLVELRARRPPRPVGDRPLLDQVPVVAVRPGVGEWEIRVASAIGRSATDLDGRPVTVRDTVLRAARRP
ncbi:MAG: hypothetical protein ACHQCE_23680 [Streptosporangiales bacterium]